MKCIIDKITDEKTVVQQLVRQIFSKKPFSKKKILVLVKEQSAKLRPPKGFELQHGRVSADQQVTLTIRTMKVFRKTN